MTRQPDSFEFELTDLDQARRALEELPPGVGELATLAPGYWEAQRRKSLPADRALAGMAIDWLLALPSDVRPRVLCDRFPRIANKIAASWGNPGHTAAALQHLLTDERGGRRGFGLEVEAELRRLLRHALEQPANRTAPGGSAL